MNCDGDGLGGMDGWLSNLTQCIPWPCAPVFIPTVSTTMLMMMKRRRAEWELDRKCEERRGGRDRDCPDAQLLESNKTDRRTDPVPAACYVQSTCCGRL